MITVYLNDDTDPACRRILAARVVYALPSPFTIGHPVSVDNVVGRVLEVHSTGKDVEVLLSPGGECRTGAGRERLRRDGWRLHDPGSPGGVYVRGCN